MWLYVWWFQEGGEWTWTLKIAIFRSEQLMLSFPTSSSLYNYNWNSLVPKHLFWLYDSLEMLPFLNSCSVSSGIYLMMKLYSATKPLGRMQGVHNGKAVTHQREPWFSDRNELWVFLVIWCLSDDNRTPFAKRGAFPGHSGSVLLTHMFFISLPGLIASSVIPFPGKWSLPPSKSARWRPCFESFESTHLESAATRNYDAFGVLNLLSSN